MFQDAWLTLPLIGFGPWTAFTSTVTMLPALDLTSTSICLWVPIDTNAVAPRRSNSPATKYSAAVPEYTSSLGVFLPVNGGVGFVATSPPSLMASPLLPLHYPFRL